MIRFLLDTSSDYTVEEVKAKGMELVPLHITLGEADYRDAYDLTKDAFLMALTPFINEVWKDSACNQSLEK